MIKHCFPFIILISLSCLFKEVFPQSSTYRLLRYVNGSGGTLSSQNSLYHQMATVGEIILGDVQTENYLIRSGFWNYSPLGASGVNEDYELSPPDRFQLYQNFPNPFNPSTIIKYDLSEPSIVNIEVFNILGEKIVHLVNSETKEAGRHQVTWDGKDSYSNNVSSGMYIYRIEARSENLKKEINREIKKMIFLK